MNTATVKPYMLTPITNVAEADAFQTAMAADDLLFHWDGSPENIVDLSDPSYPSTFTAEQCKHIRARVAEMRELNDYDLFETALKLSGHSED